MSAGLIAVRSDARHYALSGRWHLLSSRTRMRAAQSNVFVTTERTRVYCHYHHLRVTIALAYFLRSSVNFWPLFDILYR